MVSMDNFSPNTDMEKEKMSFVRHSVYFLRGTYSYSRVIGYRGNNENA
jgi:hypothetical protein